MSLDFWQVESFVALPWLAHGVTYRTGGTSVGAYRSLNLGLHVGDASQAVVENRRRVVSALGFELSDMVCAEQVHGGEVAVVSSGEAGRGSVKIADVISGADALVTDTPGLLLTLCFADCVPVFFVDPVRRVVAVAHAGWRGMVAGVIGNTVRKMHEGFSCQPDTVFAAVGPCIGPEAFEVGPEVARYFAEDCLTGYPRPHVDLRAATYRRLISCGLLATNIQRSEECTASYSDKYFSHRRDGGGTGRMAAVIGIRTEQDVAHLA